MSLGEHLADLTTLVYETGTDPEDGCVVCGRKQVILHPVGKSWACSDCHTPIPVESAEAKETP